jgi:PAS domain S-box-containing protein
MTAAATDRAERQAQFETELSETAATRDEFKRRFSDAETALAVARQDHEAAATEVGRLLQREADLTCQLTHAEAAFREAAQQHASAMMVAATEHAERQAQFEIELSQTAATRDEFKQRFSDAETALAAARQDHAAAAHEVGRLTQREADLTAQLTHAEAAFREAEQQHESAMTAAATERADRQAQFELELSQTAATRDEFKRRFSDAETALAGARHDHAAAATEAERLTRREAELTSELSTAATMRSTLERQLSDAATALKDAKEGAADREVEFDRLIGHERTMLADVEQRLAQETARREALDSTVADMRSAAADAEQRFRDEFASLTARARDEVSRLENQFANEREGLERARLTAESDGRRLAAQLAEAKQNLDEARANFEQTLDCVSNEHADSQAKLLATVAERDARIEDVEKQLEESRLELRRQFLRAPLALWRCGRDGALTHANRALADLAGYRQPDELRGADFVNTVFESTDDLSWLIERCVSTKTRQSVETAWKRKKGERLIVRLSAVEFAPDLIEIAVEDVTHAHVLEERLARAHRMEAVARLASEIAVTCGRLLGDVHEDGQQWLLAVSDDSALRKRGERLLGEVARAASYLERLAAHGDEQTSALKPVELNRVLRDLKPVLKHVAGDDVELELSKTSSTLNVDMKADRVERLFVNLASYGRERMPVGGRLKIELATVVVDQKFIADHPNVRRGHHALITVTAMRRATATAETLHTGSTEAIPNDVVSEKPGVDLGALQELLQECGGHLWLTVDPPGNMVVKIRLPLRVWDDQPHSDASDTPSRKGAMARWFRH